MRTPANNDGKAYNIMKTVINIDQLKRGRCLNFITGARILIIVTMKLTDPSLTHTMKRVIATAVKFRPRNGLYLEDVKGAYNVHPTSAAP